MRGSGESEGNEGQLGGRRGSKGRWMIKIEALREQWEEGEKDEKKGESGRDEK